MSLTFPVSWTKMSDKSKLKEHLHRIHISWFKYVREEKKNGAV